MRGPVAVRWTVIDRDGHARTVDVGPRPPRPAPRNVPLWSVLAVLAALVFGVGAFLE